LIVRVKLFAAARQLVGADVVDVEVDGPATVAGTRRALVEQFPALSKLAKHALFAVNAEYASSETPISPEDEIACIPPVSGG
jgi:molybdopterin converting factor subunit 1